MLLFRADHWDLRRVAVVVLSCYSTRLGCVRGHSLCIDRDRLSVLLWPWQSGAAGSGRMRLVLRKSGGHHQG